MKMKNEENQLLVEANENYFVVWRKFYCKIMHLRISSNAHFINDTEILYVVFLIK
jgi:hypothetical protein